MPWEELDETDKEADRCIWDAVSALYEQQPRFTVLTLSLTCDKREPEKRCGTMAKWRQEPEGCNLCFLHLVDATYKMQAQQQKAEQENTL